jgi:uncharacterized protein
MMTNLKLAVLDGEYTVHRLSPESEISADALTGNFLSITHTEDELSIVCDARLAIDSDKSETGWACIKVLGPLDFGLTGILAKIASVLAQAEISIFAISTYDTDYILVKKDKLSAAQESLTQAGYVFEN